MTEDFTNRANQINEELANNSNQQEESPKYAGFWIRAAAYFLDGIFIMIIFFIIIAAYSAIFGVEDLIEKT
ncbi:hypothetical protein N9W34_06550, partial [Rickettsiales bacterium]|nr:hypothetical protein [Rickettsiales bacterium]